MRLDFAGRQKICDPLPLLLILITYPTILTSLLSLSPNSHQSLISLIHTTQSTDKPTAQIPSTQNFRTLQKPHPLKTPIHSKNHSPTNQFTGKLRPVNPKSSSTQSIPSTSTFPTHPFLRYQSSIQSKLSPGVTQQRRRRSKGVKRGEKMW